MNRNQKIALGCGGAGCLGLIIVVIAAGLVYFFSYRRSYSTNRDYDYNVSTNRNDNSNANSDTNDNSSDSSSTSVSSMSDDDKHRLYQAAGMTGDAELARRVSVKIGLMDDDFTPGANYQDFIQEHVSWAIRNTDFIQSIGTPAQARAYVNEHMPD